MTSHIQPKPIRLTRTLVDLYAAGVREKLQQLKARSSRLSPTDELNLDTLKALLDLGYEMEIVGHIIYQDAIGDRVTLEARAAAAADAMQPAPAAELPGQLTIDDVAQADERKAV